MLKNIQNFHPSLSTFCLGSKTIEFYALFSQSYGLIDSTITNSTITNYTNSDHYSGHILRFKYVTMFLFGIDKT